MITPDIKLEESFWQKNILNVIGVDEVGRGPLAGPVVAGAILINSKDQIIEGVRDSKTLSESKRNILNPLIIDRSTSWGIGIVDHTEIDVLGISQAVRKAMFLAVKQIIDKGFEINQIIADGKNILDIDPYPTLKITKGDLYHYSISAASIIAKVARDKMMRDYASIYPNYDFEHNVGYGTRKHLEAILKNGICDIHRKSFHPIANVIKVVI